MFKIDLKYKDIIVRVDDYIIDCIVQSKEKFTLNLHAEQLHRAKIKYSLTDDEKYAIDAFYEVYFLILKINPFAKFEVYTHREVTLEFLNLI